MTAPEDYRQTELASDARRRLAEIEREKRKHVDALSRLSDESAALIAALAGAPDGVAGHDTGTDHQQVDAPSPVDMIALKVAAGRWRRSDRSMKKLASDHGALHRVGGRLMVDDERLRAGVFGHVFPLLDR